MTAPLKVFVMGLGQMGRSHALAYHTDPGFEIVGLANRSPVDLPEALRAYPMLADFEAGLALKPDLVSINTYTDSHADLAIRAMEAGAHVFVEKPLAGTVEDAQRVVDAAKRTGRKLVVGYILRHHPSWVEFIARARALGGPYVFRMNLNQQSAGQAWEIHKRLMRTTSPVVDCGVHYLDVMLQITDAAPVEVRGMGLRLSDEIAETQVNYGHLQVLFADGSLGWYEAGWGPMISETAFFVKDVMSPRGSVSIVMDEGAKSADIDTHTKTARLRIHHAGLGADGLFERQDEMVSMAGEPGHQALCDAEQRFVLDAIHEDRDLTRHMDDAVRSLAVVLAADRSMREGKAVRL
ncbi:Gfo/Idh/MocA family protein [Aureimonas phyllosphaerae]|uniref:Putative dehydrogenase n=1 Tax=Aureimonas phyllosphaerae TaxID=1166078 RepID=A0A7W6FWM8_9HYPH|nr:Gfo/Idh/MocA family oxidoreductase [Aureimonas phyllosphaerae]MBB3937202.1 putative dehydrogenase [Aureimonas phyllosphaerae]MBB3961161.1 putative dehydrogenase [Aureimonas phyllosphaerae]SFF48941.1 Predicted dehydrogenase [Aureimonas phyllosphaerae]